MSPPMILNIKIIPELNAHVFMPISFWISPVESVPSFAVNGTRFLFQSASPAPNSTPKVLQTRSRRLRWRLCLSFRLGASRSLDEGFEHGEAGVQAFTEIYGLLEKITVFEMTDNACSEAGVATRIRYRPGALPPFF